METFKELFEKKQKEYQEAIDEFHDIFSKLTGFVRAGWDDDGSEFMYKTEKDADRALKRMQGWQGIFKIKKDPDDKNVVVVEYIKTPFTDRGITYVN